MATDFEETTPLSDKELTAWIRDHSVCFEVSPHYEVYRHARRQVALDLTLFAQLPEHTVADAGDAESSETWGRLRDIALRVLPPDAHRDVEPFDAAYHLRPETLFEPEVEFNVEIWPDAAGAVDDEVKGQVHAMEEALLRLGAQRKVWHQHTQR